VRVVEIRPVLVAEIVPPLVAEMVPAFVAEMVPAFVAEMIPPLAKTPVHIVRTKMPDNTNTLRFFIFLLLVT